MNVRNQKRSISVPIIRPLACAFGLNEPDVSSGSERIPSRKSSTSMVHIDMPRNLKKSRTKCDDDDQSLFKFGKPARRRLRGKKGRKQASEKTFQASSISSASSSSGIGTRACYLLSSPKKLSKKLSSRRKQYVQENRDDIIASSSSSWTDSSGNLASREPSVGSGSEARDQYVVNPKEDSFILSESAQVTDCYEETEALVLQLHIPMETRLIESLDVEYRPFKITEMA
jgi:hypothetical protein